MKAFKGLKIFIALILTLTFIAIVPMQTVAAAKTGKYVSEVYIAYGKDEEAAKKVLRDKGFTPVERQYEVDNNINIEGKTVALLGYKTTDNIRDSITDLAVMNMRGDYSVEDYKTLLKSQKAEIAEFLNEFMATIKEYRANLKAGKLKATYIHDLLNNYTDDDTGMKMGDLLNSETLQDKVGVNESVEAPNPENLPNLVTILMQGNAQAIKSIEVMLSMATDTADNSWLDRFAASDYDALLDKVEEERPELNTETKRQQYLDNLYGDFAVTLGTETSTLRNRLNDYAAANLKIDTATEEDIKKTFGDIENDIDALIKYREWLTAGTIYEGLNKYEGGKYKKGELLNFFLEEHEPEDVETFIPMAAALSEGQRYGLPFVNLEQLLMFAFTTEENWKNYVEENKADFGKPEDISVYQNIDRDLYKDDGSVALTSSAQRANNTADGTTGTKEEQLDTIAKITAISWAATAGCILVTLGSMVVRNILLKGFNGDLEIVYNKVMYNNFLKLAKSWCNTESIKTLTKMRFAIQLTRVFMCITLAVAVFSAVMTVIDLTRDKSIEQLPIPKYMVDNYTDANGGNFALNYKAVECNREEYFGSDYKTQKGNCADLLADEGKQWLVLYASKNSKAGKPIVPEFHVSNYSDARDYHNSVHMLGERGAINIASGSFKNYSTFSQTWQNITGDKEKYILFNVSDEVKTYDESAGNMTASSIGGGTIAIIGFGSLILGGAFGAIIAVMIKNKKKKETA